MTGNKLFQYAINLCGLASSESDTPTDVSDLLSRSVSLINILLSENAVLDGRIKKTQHQVYEITSLEETLPCSEIIASSVLPYGLARLFMLGEDDKLATDLHTLYVESQKSALKFGKATQGPIREVYS